MTSSMCYRDADYRYYSIIKPLEQLGGSTAIKWNVKGLKSICPAAKLPGAQVMAKLTSM